MGPARKRKLSGVAAGFALAFGCFAALAAWLRFHGYWPTEASLMDELLALSLRTGRLAIGLKNDFLLSTEIQHVPVENRLIQPLLLHLLDRVGVDFVGRSMYLTAALASLTLPAFVWAAGMGLKDREALLRGAGAAMILVLAAGNQLLDQIAAGSASVTGLLVFLVAWGFYVRERFVAAGCASALVAWCVPGGELAPFFFVLGDLAVQKPLRRLRDYAWSFGALLLPWLVYSWPAYRVLLAHPLEAQWARSSWFADTDSGLGHLYIGTSANTIYQQAARARWLSWSGSYTGEFLSEIFTFGIFIFGVAWAAIRERSLRFPGGILLGSLFLLISVHAFGGMSFDRGHFLLIDGVFALWLCTLLRTSVGPTRAVEGMLAATLLAVNLPVLKAKLLDPPPGPSLLQGRGTQLVPILGKLNTAAEPVLVKRGEGLPLALFGSAMPLVELPSSFVHAEVADQFLDRFAVKWTTTGTELAPYLRTHSLVQVDPAGVWEVRKK